MRRPVKRSALEAIGLGEAAGAAVASVMVIYDSIRGVTPYNSLNLFASLIEGAGALSGKTTVGRLFVAAFVNIVLSGLYGFVFGALEGWLPVRSHLRWVRTLGAGIGFGALLYLFNFQLMGRLAFPWVLAQPQLAWALAHVLAFGPTLAIGYVVAERREVEDHRVRPDEGLRHSS